MAWMRRTSSAGLVSAMSLSIRSRRPGLMKPGASLGAVLVVESLEPLPRGHRLVVDALGASVAGAGPSDGFLGWGEQVRLDPHELP